MHMVQTSSSKQTGGQHISAASPQQGDKEIPVMTNEKQEAQEVQGESTQMGQKPVACCYYTQQHILSHESNSLAT